MLVHGIKGPRLTGNLLLDKLMGANVTVVDIDDVQRLPPMLEAKTAELKAAGRKPYLVSPFAMSTLSISYRSRMFMSPATPRYEVHTSNPIW